MTFGVHYFQEFTVISVILQFDLNIDPILCAMFLSVDIKNNIRKQVEPVQRFCNNSLVSTQELL